MSAFYSNPGLASQDSWVIANMVVGQDGSTTLAGKSKGLSSGQDRERFHRIRRTADAILIGGNTFRLEPYGKSPKPLFVLSRNPDLLQLTKKNMTATVLKMNLSSAITHLRKIGFSKILVEAGPTLFEEALRNGVLNGIYLTRTGLAPNENKIDLAQLGALLSQQNFVEMEHEEGNNETFTFLIKKK